MRDPVDTTALPADLAARFAALRTPAASSADSDSAPASSRSPTSPQNSDTHDLLERRLEQLSTPTKSQVESGVKVEMKGFSPSSTQPDRSSGDNSIPDDEVERYLADLQTPPTDGDDSITLPSPPSVQPSRVPLARARQSIPSLSPSLLDTLSGVEVQFFRPSLGAATGDLDVGAKGFEAGSAEDDLIRRLRDELQLEDKVNSRNEASTSRWEDRLEGLKGVVAGVPAATQPGGIGTPPGLGELERQVKKRQKRRERRERRGSGDDSSTDEEDTDTSSSEGNSSDDAGQDEDAS
ncbi:hypothetical protein JCM10908_006779 [Rhodotorula pacifica]|uniref:uncharacterized protein n=1 Tax=Rhodotorula pacifica TaxID=1495444 RepID=UPI00317A45B7